MKAIINKINRIKKQQFLLKSYYRDLQSLMYLRDRIKPNKTKPKRTKLYDYHFTNAYLSFFYLSYCVKRKIKKETPYDIEVKNFLRKYKDVLSNSKTI